LHDQKGTAQWLDARLGDKNPRRRIAQVCERILHSGLSLRPLLIDGWLKESKHERARKRRRRVLQTES
jgi:hypothetical protein